MTDTRSGASSLFPHLSIRGSLARSTEESVLWNVGTKDIVIVM